MAKQSYPKRPSLGPKSDKQEDVIHFFDILLYSNKVFFNVLVIWGKGRVMIRRTFSQILPKAPEAGPYLEGAGG